MPLRLTIADSPDLTRPDAPRRLTLGLAAVLDCHGHAAEAAALRDAVGSPITKAHGMDGELHAIGELESSVMRAQRDAAAGLPLVIAKAVQAALRAK